MCEYKQGDLNYSCIDIGGCGTGQAPQAPVA